MEGEEFLSAFYLVHASTSRMTAVCNEIKNVFFRNSLYKFAFCPSNNNYKYITHIEFTHIESNIICYNDLTFMKSIK